MATWVAGPYKVRNRSPCSNGIPAAKHASANNQHSTRRPGQPRQPGKARRTGLPFRRQHRERQPDREPVHQGGKGGRRDHRVTGHHPCRRARQERPEPNRTGTQGHDDRQLSTSTVSAGQVSHRQREHPGQQRKRRVKADLDGQAPTHAEAGEQSALVVDLRQSVVAPDIWSQYVRTKRADRHDRERQPVSGSDAQDAPSEVVAQLGAAPRRGESRAHRAGTAPLPRSQRTPPPRP